ncbi:DUF2911 domain-containing protein [Saprospiraceae bacterium]|nr:DUF2911 domain-containing protein [Saprospiraceae bacterium]MDA9873647.1 DUF2911 domain-containing protein [Saprospiraceae bacterium]
MKKFYTLMVLCLALSITVSAQVQAPQPSPSTKVEQKVGLTDVTLEYSRPGVKGRTIFGDLVTLDKMWRTGANKNSIVTFSTSVMINGKEIEAGSYAIFTKPSIQSWEINFYSETENWGTPEAWDASKVAATVLAKSTKLNDKVETFTISIENLSDGSADLSISWDKTKVVVPFTVPTDEMVMASIEKTMAGPSSNDYYAAGRYYKDSGKDYIKALEMINKSIEMRGEEKFWMVRQKALTLAKLGKTEEAIVAAEKSIALAKIAGNDDYVKSNEKSIAEWESMKK